MTLGRWSRRCARVAASSDHFTNGPPLSVQEVLLYSTALIVIINGPLERGVLRRFGGSRSTRKSQRCYLKCLYALEGQLCLERNIPTRFLILTDKPSIATDTQLADRTGRIATAVNSTQSSAPTESHNDIPQSLVPDPKKQGVASSGLSLPDALAAARTDLSEAQRSRSELQDRLTRTTAELEKLRKRGSQDTRRISALEKEVAQSQLRLKDRDEELKGKAKLLDDFQDELASLNLQLNMAEERSNRLQKENQELVDRWMARMGKEAEAMNEASRFS
ncbi:autophagy protein 16-domain-containing protein [Aspergillus pseudotamarii]|uniref:Autophagy protein 16-domain-containing protein n=1 Tax=Aspergillus pseudotamarii TaxID=132259 RepID=A0A5N6SDQ3_ASPPS|nr:autophagy protein 16-domain-containing protein [Aspergillus pseudotamarii]KAE8131840.1 autophagy protein 16-domain-containing protein [Aspergillus pseudotamarii]